MNRPSRFAFVDESEAVRRLDVDHDTVLAFVREGRLRAYPGVGKGSFFRVADVEALATMLHGDRPKGQDGQATADATGASTRKVFDPAYKVHVRLQADLKWYDLADEDLRAWVRELHPDGYERQRANITQVIDKLQRLVSLMDDAASHWTTRDVAAPREAAAREAPAPERARQAVVLPMAQTPTSAPAPMPGGGLIQMTPRRRTRPKTDAPDTPPSDGV